MEDAGWLERTPDSHGRPRRGGPSVFYKGEGCKQCHDSGYRGRVGVFEVLEVVESMRTALHGEFDEEAIKRFSRPNGWRPLREEGLRLVEEGLSTVEEVLRVTHAESESETRAERIVPRTAGRRKPETVGPSA